ncbi:hypothetical protein [Streptomyces sp. NPDC088757]|uniref:hypothetical protein n=1 Tax=Streptomyces sp. NPDC088757 TaxID=3365889 RepID=UPI0038296F90
MNTGAKIAAFAAALAATFGAAYGVGAAVGPSEERPAVEEHTDRHEKGSHEEGSREGHPGPDASFAAPAPGAGAYRLFQDFQGPR